MHDAAPLENALTPKAAALVLGRDEAGTEALAKVFRHTSLVTIPEAVRPEALAELRNYFGRIGTTRELPDPSGATDENLLLEIDALAREHPFIQALLRNEDVLRFFERVDGRAGLNGHKPSLAIRFTTGDDKKQWHFDGPRSLTLVLPLDGGEPDVGGEFGYFPRLRRSGMPGWQKATVALMIRLGLHRLFRPERLIPYTPGTFIIFDGDVTLHRAMPLKKPSLRRSLLLTYML